MEASATSSTMRGPPMQRPKRQAGPPNSTSFASGGQGGAPASNGNGSGAGHFNGADVFDGDGFGRSRGKGKGGDSFGRGARSGPQKVQRGAGARGGFANANVPHDRQGPRGASKKGCDSDDNWRARPVEQAQAIDAPHQRSAPVQERPDTSPVASSGQSPQPPATQEGEQTPELQDLPAQAGERTPESQDGFDFVPHGSAVGPAQVSAFQPADQACSAISFGSFGGPQPTVPQAQMTPLAPSTVVFVPMMPTPKVKPTPVPTQLPVKVPQDQMSPLDPPTVVYVPMMPTPKVKPTPVPTRLPVKASTRGMPRLTNAKIVKVSKAAPPEPVAGVPTAASVSSTAPAVAENGTGPAPTPAAASAQAPLQSNSSPEAALGVSDATSSATGEGNSNAAQVSGQPANCHQSIDEFMNSLRDQRGDVDQSYAKADAEAPIAPLRRVVPVGRGRGRGRLMNARLERGRGRGSGVVDPCGGAEVEIREEAPCEAEPPSAASSTPATAPPCAATASMPLAVGAALVGRGSTRGGRRSGRSGRGVGGSSWAEDADDASPAASPSPVSPGTPRAEVGEAGIHELARKVRGRGSTQFESSMANEASAGEGAESTKADADEADRAVAGTAATPSCGSAAVVTPERRAWRTIDASPPGSPGIGGADGSQACPAAATPAGATEAASSTSPAVGTAATLNAAGLVRIESPRENGGGWGTAGISGWERAFTRDDQLMRLCGLWCKKVEADGACLFRAFSDQLEGDGGRNHLEYRGKCVNFLEAHRTEYAPFVEGNFKGYCTKLREPAEWGGELEAQALCRALGVNAIIHRPDLSQSAEGVPEQAVEVTSEFVVKDAQCVSICFHPRYHAGAHYNSVRWSGDEGEGLPPTATLLELREKMCEALRARRQP